MSTFQLPNLPAFVFDIDGVLIRGGNVFPFARRALAKLYTPDGATCTLHHCTADSLLPYVELCVTPVSDAL